MSITKAYLAQWRRTFGGKGRYLILLVILATMSVVSFAQTAVPVEIEIPVDSTINYLNQWIEIFAPIMLFIGMIPVALGLLRYVTGLFRSAFGA